MKRLTSASLVAAVSIAALAAGAARVSASAPEALTLSAAVKTALAKSPVIQQAREHVHELDEDVSVAWSAFFPTVSAPLSAQYRKDPLTSPLALFGGTPYNSYSVGVTANQPIFEGSLLSGGLGYAKATKNMSDYDRRIAERTLIQNVISAFYAVLLNQKNVATYRHNIDVTTTLLKETEHRQHIGRSQVLDVLQMKTTLALLEPKLTQAENAVLIAASQLAFLVADRQASEIQVDGTLEPLPWNKVEARLKGESYHILENEKIDEQYKQLEGTRDITLAAAWPTLNAVASWSRSAYDKSDLLSDDATTWSLGLQLSIPLFSGLSSYGQRRVLNSQQTQIDESRAALLDSTSLAQVQSKRNLDSEISVIDSSHRAFDLSEASLREAQKDFRLSTIDYITYLNNENNVLTAALTYDQAKSDYINDMAAYFVAWGYPLDDLVELLDQKRD